MPIKCSRSPHRQGLKIHVAVRTDQEEKRVVLQMIQDNQVTYS